jgi:cell division protease FtsH
MDAASPPSPHRAPWGWIILAIVIGLFWFWQRGDNTPKSDVDYSTVVTWIQQSKVKEVVLDSQSISGVLKAPEKFDDRQVSAFHTLVPPHDERLVPMLEDKGVKIRVEKTESSPLLQIAIALLPWILIGGFWFWMSRRAQKMMVAGGGPMGGFLKRGHRFEKEQTSVTFEDVAGLSSAKRDLGEIIEFLKDPQRFHKLGAKIPRGVLLVGPPGTGKTLLARAVAGEANVPFYSISASEFVEMFVGVGAARVRELFEEAKKNAPSIVFIDEIDAVGRARGTGLGGGHDEREQTLNQLLSEMDGFARNDMTVVMAATNRPDVLDAALLRPGRFDRRVMVDLPEAGARKAILVVHTKDKPLDASVDLEQTAQSTVGFSGADLENLANEAALAASRRKASKITHDDFGTAYDKIVLGDPREGKLRDVEKQRVAVHESGHALLAWATPDAEPLRRVSILPRGMALGATQQVAPEDRHLHTRAELTARLLVLLGGYASERAVLGDISTGAEHDLKEATRLATKMVAHFGMSDALGPIHFDVQEEHAFLGARIAEGGTSDATVHTIESEARKLLAQALDAASATIAEHRERLDRLVVNLLANETLERDALDAVLGARAETPGAVPVSAPVPPTTARA